MSARTFSVTVSPPPSGGLPAYLSTASPWQWVPVADGTKMHNVQDATLGYMGSNAFDAWAGAAVDQDRKEFLRVANGGHDDGYDNAGYATNLSAASPRWYRLTSATPTGLKHTQGALSGPAEQANSFRPYPSLGQFDAFTDGRATASHSGAEVQYHNGRVWWTSQTAVCGEGIHTQSGGNTYNGNWIVQVAKSWDRNAVGSGPINVNDSRFPLSYANSGVWRAHGRTSASTWGTSSNDAGFGCSALMASLNKVYCFRGAYNSYTDYYVINTATGVSESARVSNVSTGGVQIYPVWAVGCDDLGIVITGSYPGSGVAAGSIHVMTAATGAWTAVSAPQNFVFAPVFYSYDPNPNYGPGRFVPSTQPVYLRQGTNAYLLFYSPGQTDQSFIRTLKIPTTAGGAYNPAGTWVWGTRAVSGINATAIMSALGRPYLSGLFGRFNIINDMGGEPVLVCMPSEFYPVYVCRLGALN
jgi:hypothetical protein